ncbi:O-antigen ligase [Paenibacillus sp. 598K]|uniref:hypothetical protein n=1 Tax=Paenibacillus sp. 598K TaxID=1117987 RepID=UPI000FFA0882|nr:hypothetical protein [Paenibacillus sp. 598K]GBF73569.1 O-antigen ligase [Paenibacillus sp. 598K]
MKIRKVYSYIILTVPITAIYSSYIAGLAISDVLLLLLFVISVFYVFKADNNFENTKINLSSLFLCLGFLLLSSVAMLFLEPDQLSTFEIVKRFLRFGLFMYIAAVAGYYLIDYKIMLRHQVVISVGATIYILTQTLGYYIFGLHLPSLIPFLTPTVKEYLNTDYLINWYSQFYYRPSSFFMEPAHYSQYVLISLLSCLFWDRITHRKPKIITAIFLTIGLILSTSSIGIYMSCFIWGMYLYYQLKSKWTYSKVLISLFVAPFFILSIPFIYNVRIVKTAFERVFQTTARTTDSYNLFDNLYGFQKYIGIGMGNEGHFLGLDRLPFMNSFTIVLFTTGYIGFALFIIYFAGLLRRSNFASRVLILTLFILSSVGEVFFSPTGIVYLIFIYYVYKGNINSLKPCATKKQINGGSYVYR